MRKESGQHLADVTMAIEKDGERTNLPFGPVHIKPTPCLVDGQMSQARQQIVMALSPEMRLAEPITLLQDIMDSGFALIYCQFHTVAEAELAFEQVIEDQPEATHGFRQEFNSEPPVRGASLRSCARWISPSERR